MTLRLNKLARERLVDKPYPYIVLADALDDLAELNANFPHKDSFGPAIRMDGDLTAGDAGYQALVLKSTAYADLHQQIYSTGFIKAVLEAFRSPIQQAYASGQLLKDPFALEVRPEPVEMRISGRAFVGGAEPFLYPRFDIGYAGLGYGLHNGGLGVHIDNPPRLISILVFLNTPRFMAGGTHLLYGLRGSQPVIRKIYQPVAGLMIASLQSNRAFHAVAPITKIDGERRAFYIAVSCSEPIWKKEVHARLSALSKNRYDPPPPSRFANILQRLFRTAS